MSHLFHILILVSLALLSGQAHQYQEQQVIRPPPLVRTSSRATVQQVVMDANQNYLITHTQVDWAHESNNEAELFTKDLQASVFMNDQLAYHRSEKLEEVKYVREQPNQETQHHLHHNHEDYNLYHHGPQHNDPHTYHILHDQQPNQHYHTHDDFQPHPPILQSEELEMFTEHHYNPPAQTCSSRNPSMLMKDHPNYYHHQQQQQNQQSHCHATSLDEAIRPDSSVNAPNLAQFASKPSHNSNIESYPLTQYPYQYDNSLMGAIRHYWREISCLCLASAVFLNWIFVLIKRRFASHCQSHADHAIEGVHQTATRSVSKDTNSSAHDSAFDETASPTNLDDSESSKSLSNELDSKPLPAQSTILNTSDCFRQRSSTLKAESIPIPIPNVSTSRSQPVSLSNSLNNNSDYVSRYSSDFDSIQRLGRGGFGVVFEAKNKIDDCHYAVKRICLPLEKEARERVMREVRALAKLDHAGIVRYYNAWLETPPDDWLKQHDAQLGIVNSKDGTNFPSTDGIYERNESEVITKAGGDSSSKFGISRDDSTSPFKGRDKGYKKYLRNNSSSPSLDIVFEGSGSIRIESENTTNETGIHDITGSRRRRPRETGAGDINDSDSEDSDFIQFESKSDDLSALNNITGDELSISSHLGDPFSSSESDESKIEEDEFSHKLNFINTKRLSPRRNALNFQREMRQLNNVSLKENLNVEKVYLYIQMQLCRKDTLRDWLKTNCDQRDKNRIFDLFYQIVDAVEYVHSQDLIHRDLKPSNIFFSLDGTLKIGDFGLCRAKTSTGIGSSLDLQEYVGESDVERGFEAVHTEQVGTQLYMSPEQLNGLSYNQKVDIFAMGLILLELMVPFKTQMQRVNVLFKARNGLYSDEFRSDHPREYELVRGLLSRSPVKRPTANEIKQHELLSSAQLSQPVIERIYQRRRTISSNSSNE